MLDVSMRTDRLTEIEQRLDAATPGPWTSDLSAVEFGQGPFDDCGASVMDANEEYVVMGGQQDEQGGAVGVIKNADADFIAHSRSDMEWLIERLSTYEAALGEIMHDTAKVPVGCECATFCYNIAKESLG